MTSKFGWIFAGSLLLIVALFGAMNWESIQSLFAPTNTAGELRLYCAAGMRKPMLEIIKQYKEEYGVEIQCDFDGSGALLSTIEAADSGDLYLAASVSYIAKAQDAGLVREAAPIAKQRPVIVVRKDSKLTVNELNDLFQDGLRLSLADPDVAAISKAAKVALAGQERDGEDLWDALYAAKIVSRRTVNAVANDIKSGTADAGVVWDATASQYPELKIISVPEWDASTKTIQLSVLESSQNEQQTLHFLRYVTSNEKGLAVFKSHGYETVVGDHWAEKPEVVVFAGGLNRPAVQKTIAEFAAREGVTVVDSYNGCGILVGQIRTGEVPDMYFACDVTFMEQVQDEFPEWVDVSGTDMVIIVNQERAQSVDIKKLSDLTQSGLKFGITNPEKSALGALSKTLLEKNNLYDEVLPNILDMPATADVLVAQVVLGGLDAAIVYKANTTLQAEKLHIVAIDDDAAHAIQPISVAAKSQYPLLTSRLIEAIRSTQSKEKFEKLGFEWLDLPEPQ